MSQVRASTSFRAFPGRRIVKTGEIFAADDPIVAGREALFAVVVGGVDAEPASEIVRSDESRLVKKTAARKSD